MPSGKSVNLLWKFFEKCNFSVLCSDLSAEKDEKANKVSRKGPPFAVVLHPGRYTIITINTTIIITVTPSP